MKRLRDPFNGVSHFAALILSLVGTFVLIWKTQQDPLRMGMLGVYGLSMAGCFLSSTLHHSIRGRRTLEIGLLKLDHAAIYPFIAGTYTPIFLLLIPSPTSYALLLAVWIVAVAGVLYKLFFSRDPENVDDPPELGSTLVYLAMGWTIAWRLPELISHSKGTSFSLVIAAALFYSIGGLILSFRWFDFWPGRFGHHELWHLFVIAGASCFYGYIFVNMV